jgi:hypothetical protein
MQAGDSHAAIISHVFTSVKQTPSAPFWPPKKSGTFEPKGTLVALTHLLISEGAAFITGQNYVIDGGMTRKMI